MVATRAAARKLQSDDAAPPANTLRAPPKRATKKKAPVEVEAEQKPAPAAKPKRAAVQEKQAPESKTRRAAAQPKTLPCAEPVVEPKPKRAAVKTKAPAEPKSTRSAHNKTVPEEAPAPEPRTKRAVKVEPKAALKTESTTRSTSRRTRIASAAQDTAAEAEVTAKKTVPRRKAAAAAKELATKRSVRTRAKSIKEEQPQKDSITVEEDRKPTQEPQEVEAFGEVGEIVTDVSAENEARDLPEHAAPEEPQPSEDNDPIPTAETVIEPKSTAIDLSEVESAPASEVDHQTGASIATALGEISDDANRTQQIQAIDDDIDYQDQMAVDEQVEDRNVQQQTVVEPPAMLEVQTAGSEAVVVAPIEKEPESDRAQVSTSEDATTTVDYAVAGHPDHSQEPMHEKVVEGGNQATFSVATQKPEATREGAQTSDDTAKDVLEPEQEVVVHDVVMAGTTEIAEENSTATVVDTVSLAELVVEVASAPDEVEQVVLQEDSFVEHELVAQLEGELDSQSQRSVDSPVADAVDFESEEEVSELSQVEEGLVSGPEAAAPSCNDATSFFDAAFPPAADESTITLQDSNTNSESGSEAPSGEDWNKKIIEEKPARSRTPFKSEPTNLAPRYDSFTSVDFPAQDTIPKLALGFVPLAPIAKPSMFSARKLESPIKSANRSPVKSALKSPVKSALRSPVKGPASPIKKTVTWHSQSDGAFADSLLVAEGPLSKTTWYLDVRSRGKCENHIFVGLLEDLGAKILSQWDTQQSNPTHVLFKDGNNDTVQKVINSKEAVKCVNVGFAIDCEKHNKRMDESDYLVDLNRIAFKTPSPTRRRIAFTPARTPGHLFDLRTPSTTLSTPTTPNSAEWERSLLSNDGEDKENTTPTKMVQRSCPPKSQNNTLSWIQQSPIKPPMTVSRLAVSAKKRRIENIGGITMAPPKKLRFH
ncbi:hypothetical protein M011DRAFT_463451 [Sporormia fimetaria CBS 119925]|uniref:BRCT domain-containing protein n=1 Tax=Sporormia fimetaria CBS 119925 TaxID=1340428 RepID=A0A6A6VMW8_9PLEO|nr:hypothetical protein M011DRAFT_463451 [Sporormia fimetaria CBS 119925]